MGNCHLKVKKVEEPSVTSNGVIVEEKPNGMNGDNAQTKVTIGIFGLDDAGKTTITKQLQCESIELVAPTVGFSRAEIDIPSPYFTVKSSAAKNNKTLQNLFKNVHRTLVIYDLGGGVRIRDIWKNYLAEIHAAVFVLDSSNAERLEESCLQFSALLKEPAMKGKPILLFANKQDIPTAKHSNDLSDAWRLKQLAQDSGCVIEAFECVAIREKMDERIIKGLHWLLGEMEKNFELLDKRVQQDSAEQRRRDEEEKLARRERVRKVREERERQAQLQAEASGTTVNEADSGFENGATFTNPFQPIETLVSKSAEPQPQPLQLADKGVSLNSTYVKRDESLVIDNAPAPTAADPAPFSEQVPLQVAASAVRISPSPPTTPLPPLNNDTSSRRPSVDSSVTAQSTARKKQKGGMRNIFNKRARVGTLAAGETPMSPQQTEKSDDEGRVSEPEDQLDDAQ